MLKIKAEIPRSILKWAGGKTQMLGDILERMPSSYGQYIEPFVGGGALFFRLQYERSIITDLNPELINLYKIVASDCDEVIRELKKYKKDERMALRIVPFTLRQFAYYFKFMFESGKAAPDYFLVLFKKCFDAKEGKDGPEWKKEIERIITNF
ncbi:hypothetical protein LRP_1385 [Ligilactobacillus ruminis]|uniref:DNA adenine methylase n=1 Tax=Ligilactobacillus ruminis TaxID=1623 RepID=UPI00062CC395|nr:DNA adenine methylase [Ligilactobacillus ruminis]KLA43398.1 hypothetical protein LRP_1385 [Ligilactobacillus ruminis]